ncbi:hypothetical protein DDW10_02060 [Sulfolobales archaeon SCGC AB-777_J03]|nr:hypothetical protein DDW10_02060 [Sulfolobales archaeon SCGC AB-777_J03]
MINVASRYHVIGPGGVEVGYHELSQGAPVVGNGGVGVREGFEAVSNVEYRHGPGVSHGQQGVGRVGDLDGPDYLDREVNGVEPLGDPARNYHGVHNGVGAQLLEAHAVLRSLLHIGHGRQGGQIIAAAR